MQLVYSYIMHEHETRSVHDIILKLVVRRTQDDRFRFSSVKRLFTLSSSWCDDAGVDDEYNGQQ